MMQRSDPLEKTLMLGKIEGRRRKGYRGWDGWMASLTQWSKLRETVKDREAWHSVVHGVTKSWTWLSDRTTRTIQVIFPSCLHHCLYNIPGHKHPHYHPVSVHGCWCYPPFSSGFPPRGVVSMEPGWCLEHPCSLLVDSIFPLAAES